MIDLLFAAALAVSRTSLPPALPLVTTVAPAGDAADEIAHALAPRESLRAMILMRLTESPEGMAIAARYGETRADAIFSAVADAAAWRHLGAWEASLAAAYRETLAAEELERVREALRRNDRAALQPVAARVGMALYTRSGALLAQASDETIAAARERLPV